MTSKQTIEKIHSMLMEVEGLVDTSIEREQLKKSLMVYYGGDKKPNLILYLHALRESLRDQIMGLEYAIENSEKL